MHLAVWNVDPSMVALLLEHDANVSVGDRIPLHVASNLGSRDIVQMIKNHMTRNGITCPICIQPAAKFDDEEHMATPCCHQFICLHDLAEQMARYHQCPLCRSRVGW